jgi:hypothetical protein
MWLWKKYDSNEPTNMSIEKAELVFLLLLSFLF